MKITAQTLEISGFTQAEVDRYFQVQDRMKYYGVDGLTISDRKFIRSAEDAVAEVDNAHKAALVAGCVRRLRGGMPMEEKLHFRWVAAELAAVEAAVDLDLNEISCHSVVQKEVLRALKIYNPNLGRTDLNGRFRSYKIITQLIELGLNCPNSRTVSYDTDVVIKRLQSEFPKEWKDSWDINFYSNLLIVAVPMQEEFDFSRFVRPEIERMTRENYRSIQVAVEA